MLDQEVHGTKRHKRVMTKKVSHVHMNIPYCCNQLTHRFKGRYSPVEDAAQQLLL